MNIPFGFCIRPVTCGLALLGFASEATAQTLSLKPLKPAGIYAVGEKIGWTVEVTGDQKITTASYTLKKNGLTVFETASVDLSSGHALIETSLAEPGAVLLEVQLPPPPAPPVTDNATPPAATQRGGRGPRNNRALAGALVAPEKLQPSSPRPAEFDTWWAAKIEQLHAIPANPQLTPGDSGKEGVDYATLTLDNINGTRVQGQIAKPKREGKFPALLILQWAGVYALKKTSVTDRAAEGWLALNVEPHDLPPTEPDEFYRGKLTNPNYWRIGDDDRETSYFLRMYLGDFRAVDYLMQRPDWDGRTLVVKGDSMGGQQTIVTAGLHPGVTAMMALVPSSCDMTAPEHGRAAGFPDWANNARQAKNPKILEAGRYFDPVNFASRIKVQALVAMGFIDETCPPTGVWSALNQIKGPTEPLPLINSPHQDRPVGVQKPWQVRSAEWLAILAKGESPVRR